MPLKELNWVRLIRFSLVGITGFLVDAAVLYAAIYLLDIPALASRLIAFSCAATTTWFGNRVYTFRDRPRSGRIMQWRRFLVAAVISAIPNLLVFQVVLSLLGESALHYLLALITGISAGMLSNYCLCNRFVFPEVE